jgi:cell division protein FtsI (penicillin-binding protein 3)
VSRRSRRLRRGRAQFRLRVSFLLVAIVASVFAGRLVQLQGVDASTYSAMAQQEAAETITLPATRGSIVDRFGVPLAQSVSGEMLTADPTMTSRHATAIAAVLTQRLGLDYFNMVAALRTPNTRFVYLARHLRPQQADGVVAQLAKQGLTGVFTARDPIRSYPANDVAGNIVGFLGSDGSGLAGLEYAFNAKLAGRNGSETFELGPDGSRIPLTDNFVKQPRPGTGIALTIDRDLQWYVQRRLNEAVKTSGADSGAVVVLDVRTGQVLALADSPTVNPNDPAAATPGALGSRAVQDVYEPGSVEKVLTSAALLDAGYVTPRTKITVPSELVRDGHVIHDYFSHGTLHLTLTGVIAESSNIGMVLAAEQMPGGTLYRYLRKFGLGQRTGVGLPGESPGLLPRPGSWQRLNHDTIAFGQGLSVNAVQMAAAVATIANGGVRVPPTLIKGYLGPGGAYTPAPAPSRHRVVSRRAATAETHMMEAVTGPTGTAPLAAIPGYRVAGKTGTSQRVDPTCGCYRGVDLSFAGFAPADNPRFLTYIVLRNPTNGGGGGSTGGPVFHDVMSYALQKYGVPPTGAKSPKIPLTW